MHLSRRRFIALLGAATAASRAIARSAGDPVASTVTGSSEATLPWHQGIRRVGQVNFNELDPASLDVEAWIRAWKELRVDTVQVSVTGIIAFYPTKIPFHRRSRWLGDRDLFGECCDAAKKRGIRVIARLSPDLAWDDALEAHPEWFRRAAGGSPVPHKPVPGLFNTCEFTTYHSEHMVAIMREINSRYDVDGIFTNAWPYLGNLAVCHCGQCRDAPPPDTPEFHERHLQRVLELWRLYTAIAREKNPDNIYCGNLGWGVGAQTNLNVLGNECLWFNCDNQGREDEAMPIWMCTQQGRACWSVMKGRTTTSVIASWATGKIRWRNTAKNHPEATMWMAQTVASGMRVWYHWVGAQGGLGEDQRWQQAGREFFQWQQRHDPHFTYRQPIANLGVVWAQRPNCFYDPPGAEGGERGRGAREFIHALHALLVEGRFAFDFVHEDDLGAARLRKYDALLLPNVALLSDAQCAQIRAYVESGGSLLATFETGLYDERGDRRADFGLGDLFGVARDAGDIVAPVAAYGSYARIQKPHAILDDLDGSKLLPGSQYVVPVRAKGDAVVMLTSTPAYSGYPPEMAFSPPDAQVDRPAAVVREIGRSRLVYFAGDCERSAWRSGNTDVARLVLNSIRWVLRDRAPVRIDGEGIVEIFAWQTDPGFALHVLNYTNPHLHRGWIRDTYPIGPQRVRFTLPDDRDIARVSLLRAEQDVPFTRDGRRIEFTIPSVLDYEVAAIVVAQNPGPA